MARERGKPVFMLAAPDVADDRQVKGPRDTGQAPRIPDFLKDTQFISLAGVTEEEAYRRLWRGVGEARELTLEVSRGGALEGTVVDERGSPVAGAEVRGWCYTLDFLDYSNPLPPQRRVVTDESGRFVIDAIGSDFWQLVRMP